MTQEKHAPWLWAYRALGAGIAIAIMEVLARFAGEPLSRVPFVTSIVLVMAAPDSDPAHPWAIIGGHFLSSGCGLLCLWIAGPGETSAAAAVGLATFSMLALRAVHPPAGMGAFLVPLYQLPVYWLFSPVLTGALLLTLYSELWRRGERRLMRNELL